MFTSVFMSCSSGLNIVASDLAMYIPVMNDVPEIIADAPPTMHEALKAIPVAVVTTLNTYVIIDSMSRDVLKLLLNCLPMLGT
jgi:hypothetical protein